jgi:hypothetical protein
MPHVTIRNQTKSLDLGWQLFKSPVTSSDTDVIATSHTHLFHKGILRDSVTSGFTEFDFIDVGAYASIRVMMLGKDTNNDTGTIHLYGVSAAGILERIGSVAIVLGNVSTTVATFAEHYIINQNPPGNANILHAFDDGTNWFFGDTYTETDTAGALQSVDQTDRPGWFDIHNMEQNAWQWIMPTMVLDGAQAAIAMGGIFRGLTRRNAVIHSV